MVIVFLQLVVTVIFAQRHFEGVTHQMTDSMLREITLVLRVAAQVDDPKDIPIAAQHVRLVRLLWQGA